MDTGSRLSKRQLCELRVLLFAVTARGISSEAREAQAVDISGGEVGLVTPHAPAPGSRVFILFDGQQSQRLVYGTVKNSTRWSETSTRIGVELRRLPEWIDDDNHLLSGIDIASAAR